MARQRKVTPAPGRGNANRPLTSQAIHEKTPEKNGQRSPKSPPHSRPEGRSTIAPARGGSTPPCCFSSHARRSSRGVTPNRSR
ncbi:transcriptional regulator, AraC family domain protein [Burkholderia pseudomallei MSHR5492]|nr:transcriptional regulator, AraC family domain protein [Burkholderia pseudomallei MSHR5492]